MPIVNRKSNVIRRKCREYRHSSAFQSSASLFRRNLEELRRENVALCCRGKRRAARPPPQVRF